MDVHIGQGFLDGSAQPDIEVSFHLGRQTSLNAHLRGTVVPCFPGPPYNLLYGKEISFLFPEVAAESAESATLDADIGKVDVTVNYVSGDVSDRPAAQFICHKNSRVVFGTGG